MQLHTTLGRAGVVAFALAAALALGTPASAASAPSRNGACDSGEVCFYYNSNHAGSLSDMSYPLAKYGSDPATCNHFIGPGNGKGLCLKNDAASVWNRTTEPVTVYYNSNYAGPSQTIPAGGKVNLTPTLKNQNASHQFGGSAPYGVPNVNPHPSALSRAPQATPRTQLVVDEIARLTGERDCTVGPYRNDPRSDHDTGNALDCLISNNWGLNPTAAQLEQGWRLANWSKEHADRLKVRYVIWQGKIWSLARSSEGWREYTGPHPHHDHVHVSIQNPRN